MGGMAAGGIAIALDDNDSDRRQYDPTPVELTYDVSDFDQVSTAGPQDIFITRGDEFSVRFEGNQGVADQMEAVVEDGRLLIRPHPERFSGDWNRMTNADFHITMPELNRLWIQGSGDISVDEVQSEDFEAIISGTGEISVDRLEVEDATFRITGAGNLDISGTADEVDISISGAGDVQAQDLIVQDAVLSITGYGEVELTAQNEAEISASGAGEVDIYGSATCSISQSGFADVSCENAQAEPADEEAVAIEADENGDTELDIAIEAVEEALID